MQQHVLIKGLLIFRNMTMTILSCINKCIDKIGSSWRVIYFFFSKIHTNLWVWLWLSGEGKSQWGGQHEFNSHRPAQGAETLCCPFVILCGTEPVSALTITLLYCSTLNIFFLNFFNGNVALTGLYVSLNMKMWLPFFEAIGVRSWARTSGAWAWI